ncbi:MAG TPA: 5-(carboxyamino)imidazole ribonucleotide synthase [Thermoanaerobaculia bacterium]|nr:5-(carboxyamino)imidazole ribonucleotide synthase [Thermoanaerobaculia bacterium]
MIVGVLGGGQLARMLALAGHSLGLRFMFLDPAPDACAAAVGEHVRGDWEDQTMLERLAGSAAAVTYEFENVPAASVRWLAQRVAVHPSPDALAAAQDRLAEKRLFRELDIPTPRFEAVNTAAALERSAVSLGLPAVAKTRTHGYDGKGQALIRYRGEVAAAWQRLGRPSLVEEHIPFDRELSVIGVRERGGEMLFYPLAENTHRNGILRTSISRPGDPMEALAHRYAGRLLERLEYNGVLALELFQRGQTLLANEFAPRVHNSGHWTIEGAETSQFENHLRAVLGLPLGSTAPAGFAAMVNCIGALPDPAAILRIRGAHLHVYGKSPRPGRKVGHVTVRAATADELTILIEQVSREIPDS